ncbi:MAG: pseudouridine synthase [Nannocystaceae bacterium]
MPRIDRLLAHNLGLPRRHSTRLFRQSRVRLTDGTALKDPGLKVAPLELPMDVLVDGERHTLHERYHLLQHKPVGVVTALRDDRHTTVLDLLGDVPLRDDLRAIGRLDLDVSGLLLWTTDGGLLHRLTHPRYAIPRVYQAALDRPPGPLPTTPLQLDDGYEPQIHGLTPLEREAAHPGLLIPEGSTCLAEITVSSGRFHEVKRIFAALGSEVLGLCRVAYGPVTLPEDLPAGEHREIDLRPIFAGIHPRSNGGDDADAPAEDDDDDDDDDDAADDRG